MAVSSEQQVPVKRIIDQYLDMLFRVAFLHTTPPPNFSSTLNKGTEIYSIQGFKEQYAMLAVSGHDQQVLYRGGKVLGEKGEYSLTVGQVISMVSTNPTLAAVELLEEEHGALVAKLTEQNLLTLFSRDLVNQPILPWDRVYGRRIPLNLVFGSGEILHLQAYPELGMASVFGGMTPISADLVAAVEELAERDPQYRTIAGLLPYGEGGVEYLRYIDEGSGRVLTPGEDSWSRLWQLFQYWRLEENDQSGVPKAPTITVQLGPSQEDTVNLSFYTSPEGTLLEWEGSFYRLVRNIYRVEKEIETAFKNY